jgi:hypothetical protein
MGDLLTTASALMCPHGGSVSITSTNTRVKADSTYVARSGDTFVITACPFMIGSSPHPCVRVQWNVTALRNQVVGDKVLTKDSSGLCLAADSAPQGAVLIQQTQARVKGM